MSRRKPAASQPSAEDILSKLASTGGRRTATRQAIVESLLEIDEHFTAEQLIEKVRRRFPAVNISTVYRTLDALEGAGLVDHVHLGHGSAVYHLASDEHQHLVCDRCQGVMELPWSELRPLVRMLEREYGFELDRRHFALVGRCARCADPGRVQPPKNAGRAAPRPARKSKPTKRLKPAVRTATPT